jgi:hypothetical protein
MSKSETNSKVLKFCKKQNNLQHIPLPAGGVRGGDPLLQIKAKIIE